MQSQKLAKLLIKLGLEKDVNIPNFLQIIKNNNLNYLLPSINKYLEKIKIEEKEKSLEKIISPFLLEESTEKELREKYKLKNTKQIIDKKIIAGFKIYTKDKIVDASLDTILKNFKSVDSPTEYKK